MGDVWKVVTSLAIIFAVDCRPSCRFFADRHITSCSAGIDDHVLKRGLVSDNNYTTGISLRQCRLVGIELGSFNGLFRLKHLDLSVNKLESLPLGVLDGGREVTHLNLSYNLLTELPLGLFNQKTKLELLDLKGNLLYTFQVGLFDHFTRLGHLDMSSNNFKGKELDPLLFDKSTSITFMDFSGSDMTQTPNDLLRAFMRISFINLSGCSLTEVPKFATAVNLKTMYHLMLINNVITSINDPATFSSLINLGMLNLAGNKIESINRDVFKRLKKLRSIALSGNQLREISDDLFRDLDSLTDLDLSNNRIEFVPVNAIRGTSLRNLNLSNNRFTYLDDNFLLELSNSRASLRKFIFDKNPWQCACLRDIIKEAKLKRVEYNSYIYDGKKVECVTTREFYCKRQKSFNERYIEMYDNLVK